MNLPTNSLSNAFAVGIDFGTTKSGIAYASIDSEFSKSLEMVYLYPDSQFMPTCVYVEGEYPDQLFLVGRDAVNRYHETQDISRYFTNFKLDLKENRQQDKYKKHNIEPMVLVGATLREMFRRAEKGQLKQGGKILSLTLSIPAGWDLAEKNAMEHAALALGIEEVNFVKEPTAALLMVKNIPEKANIVVIDYGGGTCDVTVCRTFSGPSDLYEPEILAEKMEYKRIGGEEIDRQISNYLWKDALRRFRVKEKSSQAFELQRLCDNKAESAKGAYRDWQVGLSADNSIPQVSIIFRGKEEKISLDQKRIDAIIVGVIKGLDIPLNSALYQAEKKAKVTKADIDIVYLVGGTCLLPAVEDHVRSLFPGISIEMVPDTRTAVCKGAARWQSYQMYEENRAPVVPMRNKTLYLVHKKPQPFLGKLLAGFDKEKEEADNIEQAMTTTILIPAGTSLKKARKPKEIKFKTSEKSTDRLDISVLESDDGELSSKREYRNEPMIFTSPVPRGTRIVIRYYVDLSDRLHLTAEAFSRKDGKLEKIATAKMVGQQLIDRHVVEKLRKQLEKRDVSDDSAN